MKLTFDDIYKATLAENTVPPAAPTANPQDLAKDLQGLLQKHGQNPAAVLAELEKQMKAAQLAAQQAAKANAQKPAPGQPVPAGQPAPVPAGQTAPAGQQQPQNNNQQNNPVKKF